MTSTRPALHRRRADVAAGAVLMVLGTAIVIADLQSAAGLTGAGFDRAAPRLLDAASYWLAHDGRLHLIANLVAVAALAFSNIAPRPARLVATWVCGSVAGAAGFVLAGRAGAPVGTILVGASASICAIAAMSVTDVLTGSDGRNSRTVTVASATGLVLVLAIVPVGTSFTVHLAGVAAGAGMSWIWPERNQP
jgi:hypothetical protein